MILQALHDAFLLIKFLFGLGALAGLVGIGGIFLWFCLRSIVASRLSHGSGKGFVLLRKLFLEV